MIGLITFICIIISIYLYTTRVNKQFFPNLQKTLIEFINNIIKNINPLTDNLFNNNIPLMKTNLYLMTFYKNIDLYNIIYNSKDFSFLINKENSINAQADNFRNLIPSGLLITDETIKTKLSTTYVNQIGFSKFFLDLCEKGVYLLDYWNIFFELFKPLLIVNSNKFTNDVKIEKLNELNIINFDDEKLSNIDTNIEKIIEVLYESILILSDITIIYKEIVDLNNELSINNIDLQYYNNKLLNINNKIDDVFNELETYLTSKSEFEYSFVKDYIDNSIDKNTFINQDTTNYITVYKMFNNINNFGLYNQIVDNNIILNATKPTI